MKLTIKDRVFIPSLLPTEGNRIEMISVRAIFDKIEFTSSEIEKHKIKQDRAGVVWDSDFEKEVEFSESERVMIQEGLHRMDRESKIPVAFISTFEKLYKFLQQ